MMRNSGHFNLVAVSLILLLVISVVLGILFTGPLGLAIGLAIALVKATLVAVFFMHLAWENAATRLFALGGILMLALLIGGTLGDYFTRG